MFFVQIKFLVGNEIEYKRLGFVCSKRMFFYDPNG